MFASHVTFSCDLDVHFPTLLIAFLHFRELPDLLERNL
jgi:hypothetical protein